jgi:hypothetical protein
MSCGHYLKGAKLKATQESFELKIVRCLPIVHVNDFHFIFESHVRTLYQPQNFMHFQIIYKISNMLPP